MSIFSDFVVVALVALFIVLSLLPATIQDSEDDSLFQLQD